MTEPQSTGAADARVRPPPPIGRRFQPGHTGNPKGGPRRPAPRTAEVEWLFSQSFTVEIDGERQRLPLAKALLLSLAHRALKGDARAAAELLALYGKAEETRAAQAAAKARKAAEDRARRAEEDASRPPPPLTYHLGETDVSEALAALGVLGQSYRGVCPPIRQWAYNALIKADPGLEARFTERDRLAVDEWVQTDSHRIATGDVADPPAGEHAQSP